MRTPARLALALFAVLAIAGAAFAAFPAYAPVPDTPGIVAELHGDDLTVLCRDAHGLPAGELLRVHWDGGAVIVQVSTAPPGGPCPVPRNSKGEPLIYASNGDHLNP
jgi:hypothetical protein